MLAQTIFSNFFELILLEGTTNRKVIMHISKEHNKHECAVKFRFRGTVTSCYFPCHKELLKSAMKIVKHRPERTWIQTDLYLAQWNEILLDEICFDGKQKIQSTLFRASFQSQWDTFKAKHCLVQKKKKWYTEKNCDVICCFQSSRPHNSNGEVWWHPARENEENCRGPSTESVAGEMGKVVDIKYLGGHKKTKLNWLDPEYGMNKTIIFVCQSY